MTFFYVLDHPLRILAADDDPIMREFASVYLAAPKAEIETAADGAEALKMLGQANYDLLLLDLDMPVLSGFEVLAAIRADARLARLPIIVISGREDLDSIDRAFELGATSFVIKPVNWRLLAYQVKFVLRAASAGTYRTNS